MYSTGCGWVRHIDGKTGRPGCALSSGNAERPYPRAPCSRFWTCSGHLENARSLCLNPDEIVDPVPSAIRLTSDRQAAWTAHCGGLRDLRLGVWRQTGARDWRHDLVHPSGSNARPLQQYDVAGAPAQQGRGQVG